MISSPPVCNPEATRKGAGPSTLVERKEPRSCRAELAGRARIHGELLLPVMWRVAYRSVPMCTDSEVDVVMITLAGADPL